jgi:hypothetical protein
MSFVVTPAGGSAITYADATIEFTSTSGTRTWLSRPDLPAERYGVTPGRAPNVDGNQVKRSGFDSRDLARIEVMYVNSTIANLWAMHDQDHAAMVNKACVLNLPEISTPVPACELVQFEAVKDRHRRQVVPTGRGTFRMRVLMSFLQLRKA